MELEPKPERSPAVLTDADRQVAADLTGFDVMGDRELALAPVPRVPGTPLIRIRAHAVMGDVLIRSSSAPLQRRQGWRRWLGVGHAEPHGKEIDG